MAEMTNRVLICDSSLDEQRERGSELAHALAEHKTLLEEKKEVVNTFKAKEQQITMRVGSLQQVVETRREYREVDCVEYHDYKAGKVYVQRDDLGTIVETRLMTHTERQQQLPYTPAPPPAEQMALDADQPGETKTDGKRSSRKTKDRQDTKAATASA
jgi:hypothetical protein